MENYNTQKPSLFTLLKKAWNEWRAESKDSKRMREYMEVISLHSKETGSFLKDTTETNVMRAYFRACKAKEAEVAKNVRAMVFGASDQEKDSLKASLMSLGIDLDSIMGEADAADGLTAWKVLEEFNAKNTNDKTYENERAAYKEMLDSQKVTYDEVPDPDPKNTRKAIYVDIGDMSREEAEEYIDRLMKQHKINTKPLYDPRKSVSGAAMQTEDYIFPIRDGKKGTHITELPKVGESLWPEVIHAEYKPKSLEETAKSLLTGELPLTTAEIATVTTDTVSIDQMPEGTTFTPTVAMPKEEKEYIEAAVAVLDDSPPEQSEGAPEPSLSSEEKK